jgi:branched-chain amino acid transport system permease protein
MSGIENTTPPAPALPSNRRGSVMARYGIWIVAAVVIVVLPHIFSSGLSLSMMSVMGTMIIFALSYNMLLGQTGLLSFGHAVFFGLGGFFTVNLMNRLAGGEAPIPLIVFPLVGGLAGLAFGILLGAITTRRAGTAFAMITLGIGELIASSALILRTFFGGEEGISTDRTDLIQPFGFTFGPQIEVYYLIGAWCFISMAAMYAITRTPFGRICNAVRENPQRVSFIGYNTQAVRFLSFSLAGLFAGIAGGLAAINFEIMNSMQMGAAESGAVILMTYIGGIGTFIGPVIGAIFVTYLQFTLSDITPVWQLYFGLLFIAIVMFAPNGIAGLLMAQEPLIRAGRLWRVTPYYLLAVVPGLVALTGFSLMVEMTYRLSVRGSDMSFLHIALNARSPLPWLAAIVLFTGGGWLFLRGAAKVGQVYGDALPEGDR